jgi:hypothetical protein
VLARRFALQSQTVLVVASVLLVVVAGCSSANENAGGNSSTVAVHVCGSAIGLETPAPVSIPSDINPSYGVSIPSAHTWFYDVSGYTNPKDGAYFFLGPAASTCTVSSSAGTGPGSLQMQSIQAGSNATVYESYSPDSAYAADDAACSAFPQIKSVISSLGSGPCTVTPGEEAQEISTGIPAGGFHVGLSKTLPSQAASDSLAWQNLTSNVPAASQYVTWQLVLADIALVPAAGNQPATTDIGFQSIVCAVPTNYRDMCIASFEYFLAQAANIFGLGKPNLEAVYNRIQRYIG